MSQLPPLVRALLSPDTYPEPTSTVQLIQTQMSFIFLTDRLVYKIKKPVNLGYLDYTTLPKRHHFCQKEIELNRRLCPKAYLDVVPITQDKSGFAIAGSEKVVEYAVKMLKLPQDRMLDRLIISKKLSPEMVDQLADKIACFHHTAITDDYISSFGSLEQIRANNEENFTQLAPYVNRVLDERELHLVRQFTVDFLAQNTTLLHQRIEQGKIRDCHGDLHAAHICFTDGICIFDCIEFNDRFRYCDTASEIAFLLMDLDHLGGADISNRLLKRYMQKSEDMNMGKLLAFYKCYRACVRAKVACFKAEDPYLDDLERKISAEEARSYLNLAFAYTWGSPKLFITVGLTGSGKSTLAESLSKELGLVRISSDTTRKQLAGIPEQEHCFTSVGGGIYSPAFTELTYQTMLKKAEEYLKSGQSVILDASFIQSQYRKATQELCRRYNAEFYILECQASEEVAHARLLRRLKEGSTSDGRWEVYLAQKDEFEPVAEEARGYAIIDASQPLGDTIRQVLQLLLKEAQH